MKNILLTKICKKLQVKKNNNKKTKKLLGQKKNLQAKKASRSKKDFWTKKKKKTCQRKKNNYQAKKYRVHLSEGVKFGQRKQLFHRNIKEKRCKKGKTYWRKQVSHILFRIKT